MDIIRGLNFSLTDTAVTLGKFDGIHRGHRLLIDSILDKKGLKSCVFTFDNTAIIRKNNIKRNQIYSQFEKDYILKRMGIDYEILFPFNEETRCMGPKDFVDSILKQRLDAKYVCVGEDYRFGKDRAGDALFLKEYCESIGIEVDIFPKLKRKGTIVSSTKIRSFLEESRMEEAGDFLAKPYSFIGMVVHGNELGRTIDLPTANIMPADNKVLPLKGAYISRVNIGKKTYKAITNIGFKPTVGSDKISVETHIIDFYEDIYDRLIEVELLKFLRKEKKFVNLDDLKAQIEIDKLRAISY